MADDLVGLRALCGLRSAPALSSEQASALRRELEPLLQRCDWFTIGIMAPSAAAAVVALRAAEQANGWEPLELDPAGEALDSMEGPVFLKGNQNTHRFLLGHITNELKGSRRLMP